MNLELKISKIKEKYSKEDIQKMFDDEWPKWVDSDWDNDDSFDDDFDWYINKIGNGAQLVILDYIIDDDSIDGDERDILNSKLIEIYPILEL